MYVDDGIKCVGAGGGGDATNAGVCFISFIVGFGTKSNGSGCCVSENGLAAKGGGVGLSEK